MMVENITKKIMLADNCKVADRFISRFIGLMGKQILHKSSGLLIVPCNSVHMFFMKFSLDIIFIDSKNTIIHLIDNLKPWRVSPLIPGSRSVLELPSGTIERTKTSIGDKLRFS